MNDSQRRELAERAMEELRAWARDNADGALGEERRRSTLAKLAVSQAERLLRLNEVPFERIEVTGFGATNDDQLVVEFDVVSSEPERVEEVLRPFVEYMTVNDA